MEIHSKTTKIFLILLHFYFHFFLKTIIKKHAE